MMRSGTYHPRLALLVCAAAACTSPVETTTTALTGAGPFMVSSPVTNGPAAVAAVQGSGGSAQVAFISLPPGALPGGTGASIRVQRTGTVVSAALVDGGLDPVAVPAVAGDTLALTVTQAAGAALAYTFTVPAARPPILVRTQPPIHKRDVPLNVRLLVVFSEPIAETSLTAQNFELRSGRGTIAGQLTFANAERTAVVFTPAANLAGSTDYELVLRPGIRDDDGRTLDATASIPFSTGVTVAPAYTLTVTPDSISIGQGAFRVLKVGINRTNFTGIVNLTAQNLPTGVRASFNPDAVIGDSSTLLLTVDAVVAAGRYKVTVQGSTPSSSARANSGASLATVPDPSATLTVNVLPGGIALSLTPASLSIAPNTLGFTTVKIARTNFVGPVTLSLSGPNGVSGVFSPNPATDSSSYLSISVGAVPAGVYALTVQATIGSGSGSSGLAGTSLALTVTGDIGNVTVDFTSCPGVGWPSWVAVQDGTGPWTGVDYAGDYPVYNFSVKSGTGGIAYGVGSMDGSSTVNVVYFSQSEATSGRILACGSTSGTYVVNGTGANIGVGNYAAISFGGGTADVQSDGLFHVASTNGGMNDLIGYRRGLASAGQDRIFINRGVTPSSPAGSVGVVDFAGPKSFLPAVGTVTISNGLGGESFSQGMGYYTWTGRNSCLPATLYYLGATTETGANFTAYGVPAANQVATDYHSLSIQGSVGQSTRTVSEDFHDFASRLLQPFALPVPMPTAAVAIAPGGAPYKRLTATLSSLPADYNGNVGFSYNSHNDASNKVTVTGTAEWRGASGSLTLIMPDLSALLAGSTYPWIPSAGTLVDWSVFAVGSSGVACQDGHRVVNAAQRGSL